jgi:hypothetical protein
MVGRLYRKLFTASSDEWIQTKYERESYFTTVGLPPISSSWRRAPWDSRPEYFLRLNTCSHSPYVTPSLMSGWVCCFQLLKAIASAFVLRSESAGLMTTVYCLRFEISQPGAQVPVFISPQEQSGPVIPPALGYYLSPFTTRRATVEVIWILLHTLEDQSVMPWRINSRRTEYKTQHSRLLKKMLYMYPTAVNRFNKCTFSFPSYHCPWC